MVLKLVRIAGLLVFLALSIAVMSPILLAQASPPLLVPGDEPVVSTLHSIKTISGLLEYQARAGRIPIRHQETGEVRGRAYFMAYLVPPEQGQQRPITFFWNGGPSVNSLLLHTEMFGPRRLDDGHFRDNYETLLTISDLVFYDPVGTGFSRPEKPEFADEFYSVIGDFAATTEFIRAYRARFDAGDQPLFIAGESYGTWRASGVAEMMTGFGIDLDGVILISGGIPGSQMPVAFSDAMLITARTAAAFYHRKLAPELMQNRAETIMKSVEWARTRYMPALTHLENLNAEERDVLARELARYIGVREELIDRSTLVLSNRAYLRALFEDDEHKLLNAFDMRLFRSAGSGSIRAGHEINQYLRRELGYVTDLNYAGLERGYMPSPGPEPQSPGERWSYNHVEITPEMMARAIAGGGPPGSQPWLQNAMRANLHMRVFVAAGRYDSLNMCEGNLAMTSKLDPALSSRITNVCYEGGHMMYRDEPARKRLAADVRQFILDAVK